MSPYGTSTTERWRLDFEDGFTSRAAITTLGDSPLRPLKAARRAQNYSKNAAIAAAENEGIVWPPVCEHQWTGYPASQPS